VRAVVVGAGAWGLPAAAELARRGHDVTLVEAHDVGHALGSSGGASRIWRLSHADPLMVRLALRSVEAWRRLEARTGTTLLLRRGLLWRERPGQVAAALDASGVRYQEVASPEVGRWFPGLRPNGVDAVWQGDAGTVLAAQALHAQAGLLARGGGRLMAGHRVEEVLVTDRGVRVVLAGPAAPLDADVAVLAPGPWAPGLLARLGVELALDPVLEQVVYVAGRPGWEDLPCLYDGQLDGEVGLYAMPTPGLGYKIGLDVPLRRFTVDDTERTPDDDLDRLVERRVARDFGCLEPRALSSQVCSWTMSPDGRFVIDRLREGRVVLACGDSGTGFKFSALMGELLADLAEGAGPDPDVAAFSIARFGPLGSIASVADGPPRGLSG
jgi:sarcosine oxidase